MKNIIFVAFATLLFALSCKQTNTHDTNTAENVEKSEGVYYGEKFEIGMPLTVEKTMDNLQSSDTLNIQIGGIVESVCKAKGCWTNIASTPTSDETIFVKFKDYGFFLPLDCEGQEIVLEGKAYIEETPIEELRHYAEDEGKSEEEINAITEPEKQYKFMASGAYLKSKTL